MDGATGGAIWHDQWQDTTACCGGKRGVRGIDSGGLEVVVLDCISRFSPVTGSQRIASIDGTHFYDWLV